jgi:LmeA-like phospholipid-binding
MKIWHWLISAYLFCSPAVVAQPVADPPFKVSNGFSRGLQSVTGINLVARKVAEGALARALKPQFQRKPKVRLKLYSAGDLAAGKLQGITVSGHHLVLGVPFSQLTLASNSPIWLQLKGKPHLRIPVNAQFTGQITEPDLNRSLQQQPAQVKLKLPGLGEQTLLAVKPEVHFKPDTIQMKTLLTVPGASLDTALPIAFEGQLRPNAERNRLVWHNLKVESVALQSPQLVAQFVEEQFGKVLSFGSQQVSGHPLKVSMMSSDLDAQVWTLHADMRILPPKP